MSGILFDPNGELIDPCAHPDDIVAQMNGDPPSLGNPRPLKRTKTMKTTQSGDGAAAAKKPEKPKKVEVGRAYERGNFVYIVQHTDKYHVWAFQLHVWDGVAKEGYRIRVHNVVGGCTVKFNHGDLDPTTVVELTQPWMTNIVTAIPGVATTRGALQWIVAQKDKEILMNSAYPYRVVKPTAEELAAPPVAQFEYNGDNVLMAYKHLLFEVRLRDGGEEANLYPGNAFTAETLRGTTRHDAFPRGYVQKIEGDKITFHYGSAERGNERGGAYKQVKVEAAFQADENSKTILKMFENWE